MDTPLWVQLLLAQGCRRPRFDLNFHHTVSAFHNVLLQFCMHIMQKELLTNYVVVTLVLPLPPPFDYKFTSDVQNQSSLVTRHMLTQTRAHRAQMTYDVTKHAVTRLQRIP